MKLQLALGLGAHRKAGSNDGNKPATFTIGAGFADAGTKHINFSEPVTVTMTGGVTLSIGSTVYQSGDTIPVASGAYHTLTINNPGEEAGTITFGKRKQISYLYLRNLGSSVITSDITGMKLTHLHLFNIVSSVITGDITGMKLTELFLASIGSSVITGDITGMKLTYLWLASIGSSVITGDITGMKLIIIYLSGIGSSLSYGTNPLNIINNNGIQLLGNTVFSAGEYIQLFEDAATCVSAGKWTASTKVFTISGGNNPGWSNVSTYYATIVNGGVTVKVPLAWESGADPFPPETLNP